MQSGLWALNEQRRGARCRKLARQARKASSQGKLATQSYAIATSLRACPLRRCIRFHSKRHLRREQHVTTLLNHPTTIGVQV